MSKVGALSLLLLYFDFELQQVYLWCGEPGVVDDLVGLLDVNLCVLANSRC